MQPQLDTSHLPAVPEWKSAGNFTDIIYEKCDEGIAKITINRPEVRNAFRPLTVHEMSLALADARQDDGIGVNTVFSHKTEIVIEYTGTVHIAVITAGAGIDFFKGGIKPNDRVSGFNGTFDKRIR